MIRWVKILMIAGMASCAQDIDVLSTVEKTADAVIVNKVKFSKQDLTEPAEIADKITELFTLDDKENVTLVSKISGTETMIYTDAGYSLKYDDDKNELVRFEAKQETQPGCNTEGSGCDKCQKINTAKRYVVENDDGKVYWAWMVRINDDKTKQWWELVRCRYAAPAEGEAGGGGAITTLDYGAGIRIPSDLYDKTDETKEGEKPLLLYLRADQKIGQAEALVYFKKRLFPFSNHIKGGEKGNSRGALLARKREEDGKIVDLLPRGPAELFGGMTSTADGITVWLKNKGGASVWFFQGNKDVGEDKNEPQFKEEILEIELVGKVDGKDMEIEKFAIWLPSDKDKPDPPTEISGKIVGINKNKIFVSDDDNGVEGDFIDEEQETD